MTEVIKIEGKKRLNGHVKISGAKNATVALIPAAILADKSELTIFGVPDIADIESLAILLRELGVSVHHEKDAFMIDTSKMMNVDMDHEAVTKLRASYYFMGALLGKYKYVRMQMPGGCDLGPRPIDLHLKGFEALGAECKYIQGYYEIKAERLIGTKIYLDFQSVGATINIMLAACLAEGKTIIENAAKEPEIVDVANFLNKMGANIRGAGTNVISIEGVETLKGKPHEIIPDRIEAGTYLIVAAAIADDVTVENIIPQHLDALLLKLQEMGVNIEVGADFARIRNSNGFKAVDITTQPYPGLATDLQQPLTTLLTQAQGISEVKETIYPERFKHCNELNRLGANTRWSSGLATIVGPTPLYGGRVEATDLRCGASLVVAGLIAEGVTEISEIYHIERGYEDLVGKLSAIGAHIWREAKN